MATLGALGSLVVSLEANIAKFASDLGKAVTLAEASMSHIEHAIDHTKEAILHLGEAFVGAEITKFGLEVIQSTANLQHLSDATGIAVQTLSGMDDLAKSVGSNLEDLVGAQLHLSKSANDAEGGNRKLEGAFKNLGISSEQLKEGLSDPKELLEITAKAFDKFADGGTKSTYMMEIFGKSGPQMASALKEIAAHGIEAGAATADQAEKAVYFEKQLAAVKNTIEDWARDLIFVAIPAIKLFGATLITDFDDVWVELKTGAQIFFQWELDQWTKLFNSIRAGRDKLREFLHFAPADNAGYQAPLGGNIEQIKKEADERLKQNERIRQEAANAFVENQHPEIKPPTVKKPELAVLNNNADAKNNLIKEMDDRLKIIGDAIKKEDELFKLGNTQLDQDYNDNNVSLAAYSQQKGQILADNFKLTQSLYDSEIALGNSYVARLQKMYDAEKDVQKKAALGTQLATASAKVQQVSDEKVQEQIKNQETIIELNKTLTSDAQKYAQMLLSVDSAYATLNNDLVRADAIQTQMNEGQEKATLRANGQLEALSKLEAVEQRRSQLAQIAANKPIDDTNIAYLNLIGNTGAATEAQIKLDDEMVRYQLNAMGAIDALQKLDAIEKARQLNANTDPLSGIQRAVINYSTGLKNVAKSTEEATTRMLQNMEDALVSFVQTGKLNWRSLIDSMIADMIRLVIRQQVMGGIAKWLGLAVGAFGGGAGVGLDAGSGLASTAGMFAAGGADITVGERGPEKFRPWTSGSIVPNGMGGGMAVTYAPQISVDARADRAQVQRETAELVKRGNQELVSQLKRYNPGLRT